MYDVKEKEDGPVVPLYGSNEKEVLRNYMAQGPGAEILNLDEESKVVEIDVSIPLKSVYLKGEEDDEYTEWEIIS